MPAFLRRGSPFKGRGTGAWRGRGPFAALLGVFGQTDGVPWAIEATGAQIRAAMNDPSKYASGGWAIPGAAGARINASARTSVAMQLTSGGAYEYAAHNLLAYSEQFDNAAWNPSNTTVSADQATGPTGLQTADQLVNKATTAAHGIYREASGQIASIPYTLSCYVKKNTVRYVALGQWNSGTAQCGAGFDLDTNTVTGTGNGPVAGYSASNASIVDVGGGWARLSVTCITTSTTNYPTLFHRSIAYTSGVLAEPYAGLTSQSTYVWGFQMTLAPAATSYVPTTAAAVYAPAVEWLAAQSVYGVRSEAAATNRAIYSRDLTDAAWTATNATTAKTATGIDGATNTASVVTATAGNATVLQAITHASTERTMSIFLKRRTGTGTVETTIDGGTTWVERTLTTSWQRFTTTATLANPSVGIRIVSSGDAVDVDAAQVEGGPLATSPVFTYAASVTRAIDAALVPDSLAGWIGQSAGTLMADYVPREASSATIAAINDATADERVVLSNDGVLTVTDGGSAQATPDGGTPTVAARNRIAAAYAVNDFAVSLNGGTVATDTSGTLPTTTQLVMGDALNGHITRVRYVARRLPNETLKALTT